MPKTLFRPQGTDPRGTEIGGYRIGIVHRDVPDVDAAALEAKQFVEVPPTFNPAKEKAPEWKAPQPPVAAPTTAEAAPEQPQPASQPPQPDDKPAAPRGKQRE